MPRRARIPGTLDAGIDARRVMRLGTEYRATAGLPLVLVDADGREVWRLGNCSVCARLSRSSRRETLCREYRRRAVEESFRWGEPYISVCPFGLVTFAVPLSRKGKLSAGLLSGFSIFPQMEPDMREEVLDRARRNRVRLDLGPRSRLPFRVVPSESLRRSSRLLFDLAAAYGMSDTDTIAESREKSIQQFTIANYLEDARAGKQDLLTSLASMQNEIIDKVVLGDLSGSREIINRFLGVIFLESGMNFDLLKVRLLELIVIISRAAISKGISADGLLGPRYSYLTDINAATGFDDLFWKVTKALENFTRAVSEERGRTALAHMTRMKDFLSQEFRGQGVGTGRRRRGRAQRQQGTAPVQGAERRVFLVLRRAPAHRLCHLPDEEHGPQHGGHRLGVRVLRPEPLHEDLPRPGGLSAPALPTEGRRGSSGRGLLANRRLDPLEQGSDVTAEVGDLRARNSEPDGPLVAAAVRDGKPREKPRRSYFFQPPARRRRNCTRSLREGLS